MIASSPKALENLLCRNTCPKMSKVKLIRSTPPNALSAKRIIISGYWEHVGSLARKRITLWLYSLWNVHLSFAYRSFDQER